VNERRLLLGFAMERNRHTRAAYFTFDTSRCHSTVFCGLLIATCTVRLPALMHLPGKVR